MNDTDWYTNKKWNASIEKKFFDKLNRSRSSKYQYLKIQAGVLAEKYPKKSLELAKLYFDGCPDHFFDAEVSATKAKAYISLKKIELAICAFEEALVNVSQYGGVNPSVDLHYPFFVATNELKPYYKRVLSILREIKHEPVFPLGIFKYYSSFAIVLYEENTSNKVDISLYIDKAIAASQLQNSGMQYHQKLGLVKFGKYSKTIRRLKSIKKNITIRSS